MSEEQQTGVRLTEFLKQVADWPQPEVWHDPDDGEFVVNWSRDQDRFASVFFGENLEAIRWVIFNRGLQDAGRGTEITEDVMGMIKRIALDDVANAIEEKLSEVKSVLALLDGLAEQWGDEAVFRRCRDRLRAVVRD